MTLLYMFRILFYDILYIEDTSILEQFSMSTIEMFYYSGHVNIAKFRSLNLIRYNLQVSGI